MTMRTPLKTILGLGSAKEGTEHFWRQRITAFANVPLTIIFVILVMSLSNASHSEFITVAGAPLIAVLLIAAILSVTYHMRLGMQIIIEDYIHNEGIKVLLLFGNTLFSAGVALTAVFAILKISLGG